MCIFFMVRKCTKSFAMKDMDSKNISKPMNISFSCRKIDLSNKFVIKYIISNLIHTNHKCTFGQIYHGDTFIPFMLVHVCCI